MARRRQQRFSVKLPEKIWGVYIHARPLPQPASLRTISRRGGTLQGVHAQLKCGDVVDLQYQHAKAQFRIVWLGKYSSAMQGEGRIESLSIDVQIWDFDPLRCTAAA